jgi:hypothetical protein
VNLDPEPGIDLPKCEVDFLWVAPARDQHKTVVILGECKDLGPIKPEEFERDVANLRSVADSLPTRRFETFVLLSKLAPFTTEEIRTARTLNAGYQQRVILLTERELEPYMMYERTKTELSIRSSSGSPEGLAQATAEIYFSREV